MANIFVDPPNMRDVSDVLDIGVGNRARPGATRGGATSIRVSSPPARTKRFPLRRSIATHPKTPSGPIGFDETPQPPQTRQLVRHAPQSAMRNPGMRRSDVRSILTDFADPSKVGPAEDEDRSEEGDFASEEGGSMDFDEGGDGGGGDEDDEDVEDVEPEDAGPEGEDPLRPSAGYATLDDEKSDLLFKIQRFKKQGRFTSKAFSIFADIRELRAEVSRIRTEIDVEASIQFQRKVLMGLVSAIEFGNKKFSLANIQLDGWSEHVHGEVDTYDDVFEELFHKYRSKVSAPPEIRLLLMVGGSGLMYSMSQTMFKAALDSGRIQDVLNKNPHLVNDMAAAYAQDGRPRQQASAAPGQQNTGGAQDAPRGPRPMRGPGIDLAGMMGGLGGGMPFPSGPAPVGSGDGGGLLGPPTTSRMNERVKINDIFGDRALEDERLSDVISEDLESMRSFDSQGSKRSRDGGAGAAGGGKKRKIVLIK